MWVADNGPQIDAGGPAVCPLFVGLIPRMGLG